MVCEIVTRIFSLNSLLFFTFFGVNINVLHSSKLSNVELEDSKLLLHKTLTALEGSLKFFDTEHKNLNLDAAIGTRMADGMLKVLLNHVEFDLDSWPIDGTTLQKIRDLRTLAADVTDKAIPYIARTDPPYYNSIGPLIQRDFWLLDFASKDFSPEDIASAWLPRAGESLLEDESDHCITELLGTGPNTKAKCHISAACWRKMTATGYSGYSLTHQTFYLMIAYRMGCVQEMDRQRSLFGQPPPSELLDSYCASVYLEAKQISKAGFPEKRQDLFIEQAALCGIVGYRWFFSSDWLENILSWQNANTGCFKGSTITEDQVLMRPSGNKGVRVKREERLLSNGCLCHRTTVATAALAAYVRYISEYQQLLFQREQLLQ